MTPHIVGRMMAVAFYKEWLDRQRELEREAMRSEIDYLTRFLPTRNRRPVAALEKIPTHRAE